MVPPAPGRFSTVIGEFQISDSRAVVMRAVWSTPPPGTKPTYSLGGLPGNACAPAWAAASERTSAAAKRMAEPSLALLYHRSMRPHPPSLSPRALAVAGWTAVIVCGLVFLAIAGNIAPRSALVALDTRVAELLHLDAQASGARVAFLSAVTHLHSPGAIAAWSAIFGGVLWRL